MSAEFDKWVLSLGVGETYHTFSMMEQAWDAAINSLEENSNSPAGTPVQQLKDSISLLEECHKELKICKKWPLVPKDCMCLHCQVERFIAQNKTR